MNNEMLNVLTGMVLVFTVAAAAVFFGKHLNDQINKQIYTTN